MSADSKLDVGHRTHAGQVRERNEDSYGLPPPNLSKEQLNAKGYLYLVADGMAGHRGGQLASQLAVQHIVQEYYRDPSPDVQQSLARAIRMANAAIFQKAGSSPELARMGTTVTAAVVRGRELYVANVGDSRTYVIQGSAVQQVTQDHSFVAEGLREGTITPEQASTHPYRGVITRALGAEPDVQPDLHHRPLRPGESVLLCSDGLTNEVDIRQVVAIMSQSKTARAAADRLVEQALQNGGRDNVTVVVVGVDGYGAAAAAGLPGWLLPVAGGVVALALVFTVLRVFYRPAQEATPAVVAMVTTETPGISSLQSEDPFLSVQASPTPEGGAEEEPSPTITATETFSPTPSPSPSPSPSPTYTASPSATDTLEPRQASTPTPTPTLYPAPVLEAPPDNESIGNPNFRLEWDWDRELDLEAGERFDVRMWLEGTEADRGIAWAEEEFYEIDLAALQPGRYTWYIVVIRGHDKQMDDVLSERSEQRSFVWEGERIPEPPNPCAACTPCEEKCPPRTAPGERPPCCEKCCPGDTDAEPGDDSG